MESLCDRVAMVRAGRIVAAGTLEELRRRTGSEVTIRWREPGLASGLEPPPFLRIERRDGATWRGSLEGPVESFIAWLSGRPVADLTITRPDLEAVFRRYYEGERAGA